MTTPDPVTAQELQQEIEQTRERLGETVAELAAKADIKAQARAKATALQARARGKAVVVKAKATEVSGRMRQSLVGERRWPFAVTAAGAVMMVAAVIWRWRET